MHADFSVELGREDPALELPWSSPDKHVRYYDLKHHPELVQQIPEAVAHPELGSFLSRINAAGFPLATAKCDAWSSREVAPEEEIFGDRKFVSYIDLVFVNEADRCSFEKHESLAKELCRLLVRAPEIPAAAELVIRHCYYHNQNLVHKTVNSLNYAHPNENARPETNFQSEEIPQSGDNIRLESRLQSENKIQSEEKVRSEDARVSFTGFCLTAYVTGFGDSYNDPVRRWSIGLRLLNHALVQLNCNA
jgi:nucleoside diphosphate kinase